MTQQIKYEPEGITRVSIELNLADGTIAKAERISPNVNPDNLGCWMDNFYDNFMEQFDPRANERRVETTYLIDWNVEGEMCEDDEEEEE